MKIGVFHNLPLGGGKRVLFEEVGFLSKRHDLYLYETDIHDKYLDIRPLVKKGFYFSFDLENKRPGILNRLSKDYKNFFTLNKLHKKIAKEIDSLGYDVCLVHPDKYTQTPFLLRHIKAPTVYFCEEYLRICYEDELAFREKVAFYKKWYELATRRIRKKIDKDNARFATAVVANSEFTKRNIDKAYKIKSFYCHLGVDNKIYFPTSDNKKHILFIGKKDKVKGYDTYLKIRKLFKNDKKIKWFELGFDKNQKLINNDKELAKVYSESVCLLCVSRQEPFGLTALESMACETPVLAVNDGGYRETVVDGVTGYLLPRDAGVFAEKIRYLIENPDVVKKMGKAGREHVKKNFNWEKHNKCLEKYLYKVAGIK